MVAISMFYSIFSDTNKKHGPRDRGFGDIMGFLKNHSRFLYVRLG